jgi:hypothetical protein
MASVSGKVTIDGEPVTSGRVVYHPLDAEGDVPASVGDIQADGTYQLSAGASGVGASVGKHRVLVQGPEQVSAGRGGGQRSVVPNRYGEFDSSGITVEVASGVNEIDIQLEPDPKYAAVSGTVTVDGQPANSGRLTFHPVNPPQELPVAEGNIQPDGRYQLPGRGAGVGQHRVTVVAQDPESPVRIPPKYAELETSGLTLQVTDGENVLDIALTSQ